jgi:hypothetical protein
LGLSTPAPLPPPGTAPRTLEGARRQLPDANLVSISVPGAYATLLAARALRRGLHVSFFSDNVLLAEELQLKRLPVRRRLLCMGPDLVLGRAAHADAVGPRRPPGWRPPASRCCRPTPRPRASPRC